MNVLIAYGTTEGQTRKIAQAAASQISSLGHDVELYDASGAAGVRNPGLFDRFIVAGSVHEQRHQESIEIFAMTNREHLQAKPALFISVSLAAAFESGQEDANSYVDSFAKDVNWQPGHVLLVAGAVRHSEYGYYKEQVLEHYVLKGRNLDDPDSDHEFTDWEALKAAIDDFMGNEA